MFGHLYGADWLWLQRWKGIAPGSPPGANFATLAALRPAWEALEREQRTFVGLLGVADLERTIEWGSAQGTPFRVKLGPLLQHVVNRGAHTIAARSPR
jgi:hypothetical protein